MAAAYKTPVSVLVVIHTAELEVLLLERADRPGFWQSVTGSQDAGETLAQTARREVFEETGFDTDSFELTDWRKENRMRSICAGAAATHRASRTTPSMSSACGCRGYCR